MSAIARSRVVLRWTFGWTIWDVVAECMERSDWGRIVPSEASAVVKPNLGTAVVDKTPSSNTDPAPLATVHRALAPDPAITNGIVATDARGPAKGKPRRMDVVHESDDGVAVDAPAMLWIGLREERARNVVLSSQQVLERIGEPAIE